MEFVQLYAGWKKLGLLPHDPQALSSSVDARMETPFSILEPPSAYIDLCGPLWGALLFRIPAHVPAAT